MTSVLNYFQPNTIMKVCICITLVQWLMLVVWGSFPGVLVFICISSVSAKFYLELSSWKLFSLKPNYVVQYIVHSIPSHSLIRPKTTSVDVICKLRRSTGLGYFCRAWILWNTYRRKEQERVSCLFHSKSCRKPHKKLTFTYILHATLLQPYYTSTSIL